MLFRVVRGSSSTSLNLATRKTPPGLFNNRILDKSIIFKLPKFEMETEQTRGDRTTVSICRGETRPIETGIYVPDDPATPMGGGYACYVGQVNFDTILTEVAGLRSVDRAERDHQDIATLNIIDDLPSLELLPLPLEESSSQAPPNSSGLHTNKHSPSSRRAS
jgi:hypothetical protein